MITKKNLEVLIQDLPEEINIDTLIDKLQLMDKIESRNQDIIDGQYLSHEDATKRLLN